MEHVVMAENGRLVVPVKLRREIGMPTGGKLVASVRDGALVLEPFEVAVRRVQAMTKAYKKPGESVVEEFLAERRAEAQAEGND
jgi:bifunctional DNA-binding transcriptional regulator/antitoxin component of YhaV-PrlF toxin-antitoxin module